MKCCKKVRLTGITGEVLRKISRFEEALGAYDTATQRYHIQSFHEIRKIVVRAVD